MLATILQGSGRGQAMEGKVVIVTGAGSGQGLAEARLLADEGATVIATDISDAAETIDRALGGRGTFLRHDVGDKESWNELIGEVKSRFGRLDVLVNNAGVFKMAGLLDTSDELWDLHYRVNQLGIFLGMRAAAPLMRDSGGGSIVNVSSLAGMVGHGGIFAYATSKWAVRGMSKLAASEFGALGIRVNAIFPGAIDTPMLDDNAGVRDPGFLNMIPLHRLGTPDDVAKLVRFLASDESSYITGAEITVTCGL